MSAQSAIFNPTQTTSAATGDGFSVPRLTTTGRNAITFTTADAGMMVYDTTLNNLFIWTGSAWESVPASGDAGANGAVQYNDNGVVSGASNFIYDKATSAVSITGALTAGGNVGFGTTSLTSISGYNTLKINNATNGAIIDLAQADAYKGRIVGSTGGLQLETSGSLPIILASGGVSQYRIGTLGVFDWYDGAGGTRMTLNSTGLGVGAASGSGLGKLYVYQTADDPAGRFVNANASQTNATLQILSARNTTNDSFRALSYYNTGAAAFKFYVIDSGAIYSTSTSITGISDISLKENVKDLETGLSQILALKPRRFDWKDGSASNVQGFVAQEVEGILPDLVTNYRYNDTESKKALRLGDMIPTLVKAIQELAAEVNALKNA